MSRGREVMGPEAGPSRADILQTPRAGVGDPLWMRLQPMAFWLVMLVLSCAAGGRGHHRAGG